MKSVLIVGGGPINMEQLKAELSSHPDLIIGVDRGGGYLLELGVFPQILVGDFDSLTPDKMDLMDESKVVIKRFPVAKDETDLELALDLAFDEGASIIRILGGLGGRLDHTLGNIGLLIKALKHGVEAHLLDENNDLTVTDKKIYLPKRDGWAVSLVPLTETVRGVTTSGLKYPLIGETLFFDKTRGLHNEFTAENATVEVMGGILLVICFRE